jgi:hypothetical protein
MGNQGKPVVGIPRWLTAANLLGIVVAFTLAIPFGARASHQPAPSLAIGARIVNPGYADTAIKIKWTDSAVGTTEYALQRSTSSAFNVSVIEWRIAKNTFEFWDETFTRVGTFYYRMRSIVGADPSGFSNTVTLVNNSALALPTAPAVPTELSAVQEGAGIRFSWKDNASNEAFFRVERAVAEEGQNLTWLWRGNVSLASGSGTRASFLDTDSGVEPSYRVSVFNGKGSARSYAFGPVHAVPGVDTQGVMSMINNIGSAIPGIQSLVPTNLTSLVPSNAVGTVNSIVSPLASFATGLVPKDVTTVASPYASFATALVSAVGPVASPWVSAATAVASGAGTTVSSAVASAGSVIANPTSVLAPLDNIKIWIAVRFTGQDFYLPSPNGLWLWPATCTPSTCPVPKNEPSFSCTPTNVGLDYCIMIKLG